MRSNIFALAIFIASPSMAGELIAVENVKDLGAGLRLEDHAEVSNSTFESVAHYRYLFYKDTELGRCGFFEFSPSKNILLYQEDNSGLIYIFDTQNKKNIRVNDVFDGLVKSVNWEERESRVSVTFYNDKPTKKYKINKP